ncbi:radical SAM protein [Paraclostridium sordellii]
MSQRENPFVPIYRKINGGTNQEKYDMIKNRDVQLPYYLDVELTNFCNFNCCFCPTGTKAIQRMRGHMPDNVADAIAENVKKYNIPAVRFIRWGEPTLHPNYLSILEKVKNAGALIHINTNGSLLDEEQIQKLLDMHLDSIKFSFQGADEGTYNEMREGGDYLRLLDIVRKFHEMRGERDYPYIQISTTLTGETADQIEGFKSDIGDYCDYYNVGYTKLNHLNVDTMNIDEEEKNKIRRLQEHETINHTFRPVCVEAFDKLSINWNGDVTLCCSDYDNFMLVGNILDMDLKQIFNSRAADIYRDAIAKMQYGKIKCCSNCYETVPLTKGE